MQDNASSADATVKPVLQTSKLVVVTCREGFIALIIGIIHLIIFPLALSVFGQFFGMAEASAMTILIINIVWLLIVAAAIVFFLGGFFKRSWAVFRASNKGKLFLLILLSWVIIYVGNAIVNLVIMPAFGFNTMNGDTINLQMSLTNASPLLMLFLAGILAPVVEESLFRGALFVRLHTRSPIFAWMVSIILFAVVHVWEFALSDSSQWLRALSWVPMGIGFAFVYRRSGNIFAAITLHMLVNIVGVFLQILVAI
jgi:membrane protease YdiL (CAAX protease family)